MDEHPAGTKASRALGTGSAAVATAEVGGQNALHVRVDIGSLEVLPRPALCCRLLFRF